MTKAKTDQPSSVDSGAYFEVPPPVGLPYMHNVLGTFANAIPRECYPYCTTTKYSNITKAMIGNEEDKSWLLEYVEERLGKLADYEYRDWINGQQPFITPRELQLWRLRMYVQYIWYWNLPDDEDLAMIFNLTKRRASNLASDFVARFRKTVIYPVALRRLYALVAKAAPLRIEKHPKGAAQGGLYKVRSVRLVNAAQYLVEDLRSQLPTKRMANPYLWDKEQYLMWVDSVMIDVMKTNNRLRELLYNMYQIPKD